MSALAAMQAIKQGLVSRMTNAQEPVFHKMEQSELAAALIQCRQRSVALTQGLSDADMTVQSMEDASPVKWHLAHTTWFFEQFVLDAMLPDYKTFNSAYKFLFNSYYESVGPRHARAHRGMLTRPSAHEVLTYRAHVDAALELVMQRNLPAEMLARIALGLNHEQQHQELILTDLLHLFAQNPLLPAYRSDYVPRPDKPVRKIAPLSFSSTSEYVEFPGGVASIGHQGPSFAFDCEEPRHKVLLQPYALASRPVTNREWMEFIADGGYLTPQLWLSDGWHRVQADSWSEPLYWRKGDNHWFQMSLYGERPIEPESPVCHISYFEADAFARWAGKRLPTEFEWEAAAQAQAVLGDHIGGHIDGHFADTDHFLPLRVQDDAQAPLRQLFGNVWEWTSSSFSPYPGYKPATGAVGEYNGKFMCGQFVLRGGSCATPAGHIRTEYRNFFYPHARWQFAGLRLAEDRV